MTARPLVTVAIPFHDDEATLGVAVRSILDQRPGEDMEVLLVDDGSADGSLVVARSFDDRRVRVLSDGTNRGLVARLNQIAREARGVWLARMDADDVAHPDRLARQLDRAAEQPSAQVVCTGAWIIDEQDRVVGRRQVAPLPTDPAAVLGHGFLLHPTVLARRQWFLDHPYDPRYVRGEDKELWSRTWDGTNFARVEEPLLYYRVSRSVRLPAYRQGCASDRRLLRDRGRRLVGGRRAALLWARSVAVEAATVAAVRAGQAERLLALRNTPVPSADLQAAQDLLDHLRRRAPSGPGDGRHAGADLGG